MILVTKTSDQARQRGSVCVKYVCNIDTSTISSYADLGTGRTYTRNPMEQGKAKTKVVRDPILRHWEM